MKKTLLFLFAAMFTNVFAECNSYDEVATYNSTKKIVYIKGIVKCNFSYETLKVSLYDNQTKLIKSRIIDKNRDNTYSVDIKDIPTSDISWKFTTASRDELDKQISKEKAIKKTQKKKSLKTKKPLSLNIHDTSTEITKPIFTCKNSIFSLYNKRLNGEYLVVNKKRYASYKAIFKNGTLRKLVVNPAMNIMFREITFDKNGNVLSNDFQDNKSKIIYEYKNFTKKVCK